MVLSDKIPFMDDQQQKLTDAPAKTVALVSSSATSHTQMDDSLIYRLSQSVIYA